jgi:hypothetical protein
VITALVLEGAQPKEKRAPARQPSLKKRREEKRREEKRREEGTC